MILGGIQQIPLYIHTTIFICSFLVVYMTGFVVIITTKREWVINQSSTV